jgi:hypothetical protein
MTGCSATAPIPSPSKRHLRHFARCIKRLFGFTAGKTGPSWIKSFYCAWGCFRVFCFCDLSAVLIPRCSEVAVVTLFALIGIQSQFLMSAIAAQATSSQRSQMC